jgi:hypothetical protein
VFSAAVGDLTDRVDRLVRVTQTHDLAYTSTMLRRAWLVLPVIVGDIPSALAGG